jgi:hypothetical protein
MLFDKKGIQQKYIDELMVKIWSIVVSWWHNRDNQKHEDVYIWVVFHIGVHMVTCDSKLGWEDDL